MHGFRIELPVRYFPRARALLGALRPDPMQLLAPFIGSFFVR